MGIVYVPMPAGSQVRAAASNEGEPHSANLIVDHLLTLIILLEHREELHNIGILRANLVTEGNMRNRDIHVRRCRIDHLSHRNTE
jgi:hypothetical protein